MKIAICNQKGGGGKTTATMLLAYAYGAAGLKVGVTDRDPQQTAREWLEAAPGAGVELTRAGGKYDITITDTPGSLSDPGLIRAIRDADRVILVCNPSPVDIWSTRRAADWIREKQPDTCMALLFSGVVSHSELGKACESFAKTVGLPALNNTIPLRQSIKRVAVYGYMHLSAGDRQNISNLAIEIQNLKS